MSTAMPQQQQPDWRSLTIAEQMHHMLQTELHSDCSFLVGKLGEQPERIVAHKLILCRASAVFDAMFTGELKEKGEVRVEDISPEDFKAMLIYIYTEQLELSDLDMSLHVLIAANKYLVVPLSNKCEQFALKKMQIGDVCKVLYIANLVDSQLLRQASLNMLQEKTEEVINASSWLDAPSSVVLNVLQQDYLIVSSELSLLTACQHWSQHHVGAGQTTRDLLAQFLPYLRLKTLTAEQFIKFTIDETSVFTAEESLQILQSIVNPELSMPSGVCDVAVPRTDTVMDDNDEEYTDFVVKSLKLRNVKFLLLSCLPESSNNIPSLVLNSKMPVLIKGVLYCPILAECSGVDIFERSVTNKYLLSLTVQLITINTNTCVASLQVDAAVTYGSSHKHLIFPESYKLETNNPVRIHVTYHRDVRGRHQTFSYLNNEDGDFFDPDIVTGLTGISTVLYKII